MKKNQKIALTIVASVLAICLLFIIGFLSYRFLPQLKGLGAAKAQDVELNFKIKAPKYNKETDSKFPLLISGTSATGKKIEKTFYLDIDEPKITLPAGNYTVHVAASPLMKDGTLYKLPEDNELKTEEVTELALDFEPKAASEITPEDVALAKEEALKSGMEEDLVETYVKPLNASANLAAYKDAMFDLSQISPDKPKQGLINVYEVYGFDYAMAKFKDLNGDGIDELLVASANGSDDLFDPSSLSIHIRQIFTIKDGKLELLLGLKPDTSDYEGGAIAIHLIESGIKYSYPEDGINTVIYKYAEDGSLKEVDHFVTDSAGAGKRIKDGKEEDLGYEAGKILQNEYPDINDDADARNQNYQLAGTLYSDLLSRSQNEDEATSEDQGFNLETKTGVFTYYAEINDSSSLKFDTENKKIQIHFANPQTSADSQSYQDLELTYDELSCALYKVGGNASFVGYQLEPIEKLAADPGLLGVYVTFKVKDGVVQTIMV